MKTSVREKWKIPLEKGFTEIDNGDSVQLHNEAENKSVYLSILNASDKLDEPIELPKTSEKAPELVKGMDTFHLQGTKIKGNEVLIVVVTFDDGGDEAWARSFFDEIN